VYHKNEKIYEAILKNLDENGHRLPSEEMSDTEQVARFIFMHIGQALLYLHEEANMIHRDIKLDNILFDSENCEAKLSDFTVSRGDITESSRLFDCEGTACFTAPECTIPEKEGYLPKPTDIWSTGVCIFTYITGCVPFYGDCELQIQINTRQNELKIPDTFSANLKDLIGKMINKDPLARPTAYEFL